MCIKSLCIIICRYNDSLKNSFFLSSSNLNEVEALASANFLDYPICYLKEKLIRFFFIRAD